MRKGVKIKFVKIKFVKIKFVKIKNIKRIFFLYFINKQQK